MTSKSRIRCNNSKTCVTTLATQLLVITMTTVLMVLLLLGNDVTDAAKEGVAVADQPHPIHDIATFRSELGLYPLPVPNN